MLNFFKLRIDTHSLGSLDVVDGIDRYSYVYHDNEEGTNPHMHFFIETMLTQGALRARVKKLPDYKKGKKGNSFYSLREMQPGDNPEFPYLKYHAYMPYNHGRPAEVTYVGFDQSKLDRLRIAVKQYSNEIKAEQAERRQSRKTILQQMEDEFQFEQNPPEDLHVITYQVVQFYKKHGKLVRKFAMVSQVQTLALKYLPGYGHLLLCSIIKAVDPTPCEGCLRRPGH